MLDTLIDQFIKTSEQIHSDLVNQATADQIYAYCQLGLGFFIVWVIYRLILKTLE